MPGGGDTRLTGAGEAAPRRRREGGTRVRTFLLRASSEAVDAQVVTCLNGFLIVRFNRSTSLLISMVWVPKYLRVLPRMTQNAGLIN